MIIKREWQEPCFACQEVITLREYEEIPGGEYTSHLCTPEVRDNLCTLQLAAAVFGVEFTGEHPYAPVMRVESREEEALG